MMKKVCSVLLVLALVLSLAACAANPTPPEPTDAPTPTAEPQPTDTPVNPVIRLSTTTSVNDSGLLPYLQPTFEADTGFKLEITSAGTGAAIEKARTGDADALLVHSKSAEEEYCAEGFNEERIPFMYNYFVIVGPADDPAGVAACANAEDAFKAIAESGCEFISRGDNSGTHNAENKIWKAAELTPDPEKDTWYISIGDGMGACLNQANERKAYTLSDKGTFLSNDNELKILLEKSDVMKNTYSMIAVTPDRYADTNYAGAQAFIEWMLSEKATQLIAEYGVKEYGQALFFPMANDIVITDVLGNEVTLSGHASKLVGTHNPTMNTAIVLGGGGKYIAGFGNKEMADGLYEFVFPELKDLTQIGKGKNINYETVLTTGADLAILPERFTSQAAEFNAIGVPAIVILPSTESFDTIKTSLTTLAVALGEEERAAQIVDFFDKKIAAASEIAGKAGDAEKPSVLFLGGSSMTTVASNSMIQSLMIETAGGFNPASELDVKGEFAEVNMEQIIAWNPDVIWIPAYADYTIDDVLNAPELSSVTAVQNKAVYQFPSALEPWDYPTASASLGLCWATYNLHPELYSFEALMKDVDEFYTFIYGQTFTAEQLGLTK